MRRHATPGRQDDQKRIYRQDVPYSDVHLRCDRHAEIDRGGYDEEQQFSPVLDARSRQRKRHQSEQDEQSESRFDGERDRKVRPHSVRINGAQQVSVAEVSGESHVGQVILSTTAAASANGRPFESSSPARGSSDVRHTRPLSFRRRLPLSDGNESRRMPTRPQPQ